MASRPIGGPAALTGGTGFTTPAPSGVAPVAPTPRPDISGVPIASLKFLKIWVLFANTSSGTPELHSGFIQRLDKRSGNYAIRFADGELVHLPLSGGDAPLWGIGETPALQDLVLSPETARIALAARQAHDDLGPPSGSADLFASASVSTAPSGAVSAASAAPTTVDSPSGAAGPTALSVSASASAALSTTPAPVPLLAPAASPYGVTALSSSAPFDRRRAAAAAVSSVAGPSSLRARLPAGASAPATATAALVASNLSVGSSELDLEDRSSYLYSVDPSFSHAAGLTHLDSSFQLSLDRDHALAVARDRVPVHPPEFAVKTFSPGDPVWYCRPSSDHSGHPQAALIVAVHNDDGAPYFSVSVEGSATVRDTEASSLSHRRGSSAAPLSAPAFADGDAVWFSRPSCDDAPAIVTAVHLDGGNPSYSVSILGSANVRDTDCTQLRPRLSSDGRVSSPLVVSSAPAEIPAASVALGFTAARSAASEGGWSGSTVPPGSAPCDDSADSTGSLPDAPPRQSALSWSYDKLAQLHSALCGARIADGSPCRSAAIVHPDDDSSALPSCRHHHPLVARCGQPTADGVCLRARPCGTRHDFTTVDPLALAVDQRRASVIVSVDRALCARSPQAAPAAAVTRHSYVVTSVNSMTDSQVLSPGAESAAIRAVLDEEAHDAAISRPGHAVDSNVRVTGHPVIRDGTLASIVRYIGPVLGNTLCYVIRLFDSAEHVIADSSQISAAGAGSSFAMASFGTPQHAAPFSSAAPSPASASGPPVDTLGSGSVDDPLQLLTPKGRREERARRLAPPDRYHQDISSYKIDHLPHANSIGMVGRASSWDYGHALGTLTKTLQAVYPRHCAPLDRSIGPPPTDGPSFKTWDQRVRDHPRYRSYTNYTEIFDADSAAIFPVLSSMLTGSARVHADTFDPSDGYGLYHSLRLISANGSFTDLGAHLAADLLRFEYDDTCTSVANEARLQQLRSDLLSLVSDPDASSDLHDVPESMIIVLLLPQLQSRFPFTVMQCRARLPTTITDLFSQCRREHSDDASDSANGHGAAITHTAVAPPRDSPPVVCSRCGGRHGDDDCFSHIDSPSYRPGSCPGSRFPDQQDKVKKHRKSHLALYEAAEKKAGAAFPSYPKSRSSASRGGAASKLATRTNMAATFLVSLFATASAYTSTNSFPSPVDDSSGSVPLSWLPAWDDSADALSATVSTAATQRHFTSPGDLDAGVNRTTFVLADSGATHSVVRSTSGVHGLRSVNVPIRLGDESTVFATHTGHRFALFHGCAGRYVKIPVLVCPAMRIDIISPNSLCYSGDRHNGNHFVSSDADDSGRNGVHLYDTPAVIPTTRRGGLPHFDLRWVDDPPPTVLQTFIAHPDCVTVHQSGGVVPAVNPAQASADRFARNAVTASAPTVGGTPVSKILHRAHINFGHLNYRDTYRILQQQGVQLSRLDWTLSCRACARAKLRHRPTRTGSRLITAPLSFFGESLHLDLADFKHKSFSGMRYALMIEDEWSHTIIALPLAKKNHAAAAIDRFLASIAHRRPSDSISVTTPHHLSRVKSDRGGEFISAAFKQVMSRHSVLHRTSAPRRPNQNSRAESAVRIAKQAVAVALLSSGLSARYWPAALAHGLNIRNRVPAPSNPGRLTPHQMVVGEKLGLSEGLYFLDQLQPFGVRCEVLRDPSTSSQSHTRAGVYIGHHPGSLAPQVHMDDTGRVLQSVDVHFLTDTTGQPDRYSRRHLHADVQLGDCTTDDTSAAFAAADFSYGSISASDVFPQETDILEAVINGSAEPSSSTAPSFPASTTSTVATDHFPHQVGRHLVPDELVESPAVQVLARVATAMGFSDAVSDGPTTANVSDLGRSIDVDNSVCCSFDEDPAETALCLHGPEVCHISVGSDLEPHVPVVDRFFGDLVSLGESHTPVNDTPSSVCSPSLPDGHPCLVSTGDQSACGLVASCRVDEVNASVNPTAATRRPRRKPRPVVHGLVTPACHRDVLSAEDSDAWLAADELERQSFLDHGALEVLDRSDLPAGARTVSLRPIYKYKCDSITGALVKRKVRWIYPGNRQSIGRDFDQTYAPVIRSATLKVLFALAAVNGWYKHVADIGTAFLSHKLPDDINLYVELPPNYLGDGAQRYPGKVARLSSAVYGTANGSAVFHRGLTVTLASLGLRPSDQDPCLYLGTFVTPDGPLYIRLAVYVDDLGIFVDQAQQHLVPHFLSALRKRYTVTDSSGIDEILGLAVHTDSDTGDITLTQHQNVRDLVDFSTAHVADDSDHRHSVPVPPGTNLSAHVITDDDHAAHAHLPYRQVVGRILWLAQTRTDIACATHHLTRHLSKWGRASWKCAHSVIQYLARTPSFGLRYRRAHPSPNVLIGYSDASHVDDHSRGKSTIAHMCLLNGAPVLHRARLSPLVCRSTTVSEFCALADCVSEVLWLRDLLATLGHPQDAPTVIHVDNLPCVQMVSGPVPTAAWRSIAARYYFVREHTVGFGSLGDEDFIPRSVDVQWCSTNDQLCDGLTKNLSRDTLIGQRSQLMFNTGA